MIEDGGLMHMKNLKCLAHTSQQQSMDEFLGDGGCQQPFLASARTYASLTAAGHERAPHYSVLILPLLRVSRSASTKGVIAPCVQLFCSTDGLSTSAHRKTRSLFTQCKEAPSVFL